jgi:hypothetical protein
MKLRFTNGWLRRRIEAEPDGMSCEAGPPEPQAFATLCKEGFFCHLPECREHGCMSGRGDEQTQRTTEVSK